MAYIYEKLVEAYCYSDMLWQNCGPDRTALYENGIYTHEDK